MNIYNKKEAIFGLFFVYLLKNPLQKSTCYDKILSRRTTCSNTASASISSFS